jgi:cellulose biosynthesis protein BcsQ
MDKPPGVIYTFYSFKGGVGRSMGLANVAALLSRKGHRVLVVDWDLEAPGIERYYAGTHGLSGARKEGLVQLFHGHGQGRPLDWRDCLLTASPFPGSIPLSILTAGQSQGDYVSRLQELNWENLFTQHDLGAYLEQLRAEWKAAYDFVLVDSRTGFSDMGGICTILLPDILAVFFTASDQSLDGVIDVIERARQARKSLPVDRSRLVAIPVPSRDELQSEHERAREWHRKYAERLAPYYVDWAPREVTPTQIIEVLRVPYKSFWSFGEPLPVVEEGTSDPRTVGFAYDFLARLMASGVDWNKALEGQVQVSREQTADMLAAEAERVLAGLDGAEQEVARKALTSLVSSQGLRQPLLASEFTAPEREAVGKFLPSGVVSTITTRDGREAYTLSHDQLLIAWKRMADWLEAGSGHDLRVSVLSRIDGEIASRQEAVRKQRSLIAVLQVIVLLLAATTVLFAAIHAGERLVVTTGIVMIASFLLYAGIHSPDRYGDDQRVIGRLEDEKARFTSALPPYDNPRTASALLLQEVEGVVQRR